MSLARRLDRLQPFEISNNDVPRVHLEQSFGLEPAQIPRNEFTHGSDLMSEVLVAARKCDLNALGRCRAYVVCNGQWLPLLRRKDGCAKRYDHEKTHHKPGFAKVMTTHVVFASPEVFSLDHYSESCATGLLRALFHPCLIPEDWLLDEFSQKAVFIDYTAHQTTRSVQD